MLFCGFSVGPSLAFFGLPCLVLGVLCSRASHVVFSFYTLHFTLHTVHFLLHSILDTLRSTLCTLHSTLHTFHPALYTLHSTLYNPHFTLYTLHSSLNTRLSSHSTHASSSGSAGGSPSIILCNIFTPFYTCASLDWKGEFWTGGPGGSARKAGRQKLFSHIMEKHETKATNH